MSDQDDATPTTGKALLDHLEVSFFKATSYACAPHYADESDATARLIKLKQKAGSCFSGPPPLPATGPFFDLSEEERSIDGALAVEFQQLNVQNIRAQSVSRLFSRSERCSLLSRQAVGGAIMQVRLRTDDNNWSDSFLIITGPLAASQFGEGLAAPAYKAEAKADTVHATMEENAWPEALFPLVFSFSNASRGALVEASPAKAALLPSTSLMVPPDSRPLFACPVVKFEDGTIFSGQDANSVYAKAHLWAPAKPRESSDATAPLSFKKNMITIKGWVHGSEPSDVLAKNPWDVEVDASSHDNGIKFSPTLMEPKVIAASDSHSASALVPPGTCVMSRIILLPHRHGLPVGHVANPKEMDFDQWLEAMASEVGQEGSKFLGWLNQPFLEAWFLCASQSDAMAVNLEDYFSAFVPDLQHHTYDSETVDSCRLHLEWSITHQLFTDHWLSGVPAGQGVAKRVQRFMDAVLADANTPPPGIDVPILGWHSSIFQTTLAFRFRLPSTIEWRKKLDIFQSVASTELPFWAQKLQTLHSLAPSDGEEHTPVPIAREPNVACTPPAHSPAARDTSSRASLFHDSDADEEDDFFMSLGNRNDNTPVLPEKRASKQEEINRRKSAKTAAGEAPAPAPQTFSNFDQLPEFDPAAAVAAAAQLKSDEADTVWLLPQEQSLQEPLRSRKASAPSRQQAIAEKVYQLAHQADEDSKKDDCNRLLFCRQTMLNGNFVFANQMRAASTWLSHAMPSDTKAITITAPTSKCRPDALVVPGFISQDLRAHMLLTKKKTASSSEFLMAARWIREQAQIAENEDTSGPSCEIAKSFFDDDATAAMLNCSFGCECSFHQSTALTKTTVSSWALIRTLERGNKDGTLCIPNDGFLGLELYLLFLNTLWIFHLFSRDHDYFDLLGHDHSTFSRYSILAGQLIFLQAKFHNTQYQRAWDRQEHNLRYRRTGALLYYFAELFDLFTRWTRPSLSDELFYPRAMIGSDSNHSFVITSVSGEAELLADKLSAWRGKFDDYFSRSKLKDQPVAEGPFRCALPPWVTPFTGKSLREQRRERQREQQRLQAVREQDRLAAQPDAAGEAPSVRDQTRRQQGRGRGRGRGDRSQPLRRQPLTPGAHVAHVCLITMQAPNPDYIPSLLDTGNETERARHPRVAQEGHPMDGRQVCHNYITAERGCRRGGHCNFAHLDIDREPTKSLNAPVFRDIHAVLLKEQVKQLYKPSHAFVEFQSTLT